jgi:hypothetical protein
MLNMLLFRLANAWHYKGELFFYTNIKYNDKVSVPILKHHFMRTYGRMETKLHPFLNLALDLEE